MYDVERQRTDDDNSSQASENFDSLEVSLDHIVPESQNNALVSAVEQLPGNTSHPAPSTPLVMSISQDPLDVETLSDSVKEGLSQAMYPEHIVTSLLELYVGTLNQYRHPMPEELIYSIKNSFFKHGGKVKRENLTSYAFIATLCSVSMMHISASSLSFPPQTEPFFGKDYDCATASRRFMNAASMANYASQNLGCEDTNSVLAYLILARIFVVLARPGQAWCNTVNFVRVAYSLGLHRDGRVLRLDEEEREIRRVIWSLVYPMAHIHSIGLGRPLLINEAFVDTCAPQLRPNMDTVPENLRELLQSESPPQLLMINTLRSRFAYIIGQFAQEVQNVNKTTTYSQILEVHVHLMRFISEMPFYFSMRLVNDEATINTLCDDVYPFLKLQRVHLWFDIHFFTLILHCPYILRMSNRKKTKYITSYEACLETTKMSLSLRQQFLNDKSLSQRYCHNVVGFRWFNTVIVAGFLLLVGPEENDSKVLRAHMEKFIEWRLSYSQSNREEAEAEANMVRALIDRASSPSRKEGRHDDGSSIKDSAKRQRKEESPNSPNYFMHMPRLDTSMQPTGEPESNMSTWPPSDLFMQMATSSPSENAPSWATSIMANNRAMDSRDPLARFMNGTNPTNAAAFDTTLISPGVDAGASMFNMGSVYRMPSVSPEINLAAHVPMMPVWPINTPNMHSMAQSVQSDLMQSTQDTQQLLNLW